MGMCNVPLADAWGGDVGLDRTLLFEDGLLAINVPFEQWDTLTAEHGNVVNKYKMEPNRPHPWYDAGDQRKVLKVIVAQPTKMTAAFDMFRFCRNCTSIDLTNLDLSECARIDGIFADTDSLQEIIGLENLDVHSATWLNSIFWNCGLPGDIVLNWDINHTERVNMTCTFMNTKFTSIDLRSWDTSTVWNFPSMFSGSDLLETIYVSEKWTLDAMEYGNNMFNGCTSLIGGEGTPFQGNRTRDYIYAIIDGGTYSKGYLTGVDLPDYTLTYNTDGNPIAPADYSYMSVAIMPTPTHPNPDMHFYGWYTDWDFDEEGKGIDHILMDEDHEVIARWQELSYWVTFQTNVGNMEKKPLLLYDGHSYQPEPLPSADFVAWYREPDFSGTPVDEIYVTEDITLYAKWSWNY